MISIDKAIIVEGKYDKIALQNIIDATIIPTDGFKIFKDKEKCRLIKRIAQEKGIIVITDSDSAGNLIRSYLKNICGDLNITNVYIPQILGKERRKAKPSKEGTLGVEGMSREIIVSALKNSNIFFEDAPIKKVTKQDMYSFLLSGNENAKKNREELAKHLKLPQKLSSSAFLDAVNAVYGYDRFAKELKLWLQDTDKK